MENDELLHKWANGDLNAEEYEAFKRRPEYPALKKLKKHTDQLAMPTFDDNEMLATILAQDKAAAGKVVDGKKRFLPGWINYAAAAAVLLLLGFFFWPSPELVRFQTASGEQLDGRLPDGSTFVLNAESSLAYDPSVWETNRILELEGEAFFSVDKGKPFQVNSPNGKVEVLGTQFNVRSRGHTMEVKCQSGKVGVSSAVAPSQNVLLAKDAIRYTNGQMVEKWVEPTPTASSWREGVSKFRKAPLNQVLQELERQFGVQIQSNTVDADVIVSCNFTHNDLNLALKTCLQPLSISYSVVGNKVMLSKE